MPKVLLFIIALITVVVISYLTLFLNDGFMKPQKKQSDTAVNQAKDLYEARKKEQMDFSNGPCLSDALMSGWVADIAHNPRVQIDDLAENQCPAYREGKAKHFVELDINGELIRVK